ncbi:MAG: energy-coupling factor transporter ATPase [Oscillospiraceae bacterium]|nr:energy-coupling factor transporter ATPase [Oscillospiraceae bacterium]
MSEIRVEALTHTYSAGTPFEKTAIENIDLTIPSAQFVGVLGHTGSGKSTFIQHLNALLKPSSGTVYVDGEDINKDKKTRRAVKNKVGLVFQYPEYQLFEETVFADIAFGPKNMGLSKEEIEQRVREAADFVGVEEELFQRSPLELSGGQKRRIAIAGVIAMRPGVLILDEPTAGLDPAGCRQIMDNICRYRRESGATVLIVSHNMDDAARLTERLIVFNRGRVAMDGTPEQIFSQPEKLVEIGLSVPQSTRLAMALRARGVPLEGAVYTHGQLMAALKGVGLC